MFRNKKGLSLVLEIVKVLIVVMIVALPFMKLKSMVSYEDTLKAISSEDVRQMTHLMLAYPGESAMYIEFDPEAVLEELESEGEVSSILYTFEDPRGYVTVRAEGDTVVSQASKKVYLPSSSLAIGTIYDAFDVALYYDGQDIIFERADQFFESVPSRDFEETYVEIESEQDSLALAEIS